MQESARLLKLTDADETLLRLINNMFEQKPSLIRTFKIGGSEYGYNSRAWMK